jgi:hypothetical protein
MYAIKPIMTAGLIAALGLAPAAFAQSTGTSTAATPAPSTAAQQSSTAAPEQSNPSQEAARQALAAARQSLAELTKLPAAQQLQGEQRTAVANFISDFNAFATAQNDWRSKYEVVDESLNRLLGEGSSAGPSSTPSTSTPSTNPPASSTDSSSAAAGSGALDPTIVAKLQEVRTHLKEFEQTSGDPLFAVDAIQKQLDAASAGAGASGVTLSAAQVENIRKQLETIRQAAKK